MGLTTVTITGAGNNTSIPTLVNLSREFPFVEWGILISLTNNGNRFPWLNWMYDFEEVARSENLRVSSHVCGNLMRSFLNERFDWYEKHLGDGAMFRVSRRIQINARGQLRLAASPYFKLNLQGKPEAEFIFQWDGVDVHLAREAQLSDAKTSVLFDNSGGNGILPLAYPAPPSGLKCGYAGGLSPENIAGQLAKIEAVCDRPYWIDIESGVRNEKDELDFDKVFSVLTQVKPFLKKEP